MFRKLQELCRYIELLCAALSFFSSFALCTLASLACPDSKLHLLNQRKLWALHRFPNLNFSSKLSPHNKLGSKKGTIHVSLSLRNLCSSLHDIHCLQYQYFIQFVQCLIAFLSYFKNYILLHRIYLNYVETQTIIP